MGTLYFIVPEYHSGNLARVMVMSYLFVLLMAEYTQGDDGFVIQRRQANRLLFGIDLSQSASRYA